MIFLFVLLIIAIILIFVSAKSLDNMHKLHERLIEKKNGGAIDASDEKVA